MSLMVRSHEQVENTGVASLRDDSVGGRLAGVGRAEVLDEVLRRHADSTFVAARRRLGDVHRAEEVVQEVFLDLWMRPERYDHSRGSLAAFLAVQANSRALDRIRSDTARQRRDEQEARMTARLTTTVEDEETRIVISERVRRVLADLPEQERHPISMAFYQGRTYRQVADALGVPEGTVKSRIRSGLRRMRDMLGDAAGLEPAV